MDYLSMFSGANIEAMGDSQALIPVSGVGMQSVYAEIPFMFIWQPHAHWLFHLPLA